MPDPTRDPALSALLAEIFDETVTPMLILDDQSVCIEANRAACELFGRSRGETLGQTADDLADSAGQKVVTSTSSNISPGRSLQILVTAPAAGGSESGQAVEREPLSEREKEVLELLAGGANNNEVADELGISPETVRNHTRNARRKLGARSRSHAIALAITLGQLDLTLDA
jgi:PAS domain S-box-containing protein